MSQIVSSLPGRTLLPATQGVLGGADEAFLAVAFVDIRGVHLLEKELRTVGQVRALATSQFNSARTDTALDHLTRLGVTARLLNPPGGTTYHPKMYLARRGRDYTGLVGSANLTFGLAGNYESAVVVDGRAARDAWNLAEQLWDSPDAKPWTPGGVVPPDHLDPALLRLLLAHVRAGQTIRTLGRRSAPNTIVALTKTGATVHAATTSHVEPRMIQIGYDALATSPTGQLRNTELLNNLRVHRSSFVMALLAQLPMVRQVPHPREVIIAMAGPPPVPPSTATGT
jgi:HKD family nuclease